MNLPVLQYLSVPSVVGLPSQILLQCLINFLVVLPWCFIDSVALAGLVMVIFVEKMLTLMATLMRNSHALLKTAER